jgi:hypothetical protein
MLLSPRSSELVKWAIIALGYRVVQALAVDAQMLGQRVATKM